MGELTYKAKRLRSEVAGNMQQAAGSTSKHWYLQNEGYAEERNDGRRAFLGKGVNVAGNNA